MCAGYRRVRGIPDFGSVVERPRLVRMIDSAPPGLVLIVAPSGYGKSVLAAQYAAEHMSGAHWVDLSRDNMDEAGVLRRVLSTLETGLGRHSSGGSGPISLRGTPDDDAEAIAELVLEHDSGPGLCLVLDDLDETQTAAFTAVLGLAKILSPHGVRLVVTTRGLPMGLLREMHEVQIIEPADLELSIDESTRVSTLLTGHDSSADQVSTVYEACGGHPAIFAILVRHAGVNPDDQSLVGKPSLDLSSRLLRIAELIPSDAAVHALHIMALLGSGDLSDLELCGAPLSKRELSLVSDAIPLVRVGENSGADTPEATFRMHDLAQEVYRSDEYRATLGEFGQTVWRRALQSIDARGDVFRAGALVRELGSDQEVVDWLAVHADSLLVRGGNMLMRQMIAQLPVTLFVQYPQLLLAQARLLQEESLLREAIEKATVARTIAEHEQDSDLLAESLLLCGQCYLDIGEYEAAIRVLNNLTHRADLAVGGGQLAWAFAALGTCHLYTGDAEEAIALVARARACLDASSEAGETVSWFVHTVAGAVEATTRGDVAGAMRHYTHASEVDDVPRYLLAKAKGNLAVALCEMGRLRRSTVAVHQSMEVCLETQSARNDGAVMRAAFLPVWGAAEVGLGAVDAGLKLMREGIELGLRVGDRYGASYNRIYASTALRSVGRFEEALGEAETALEFFSGVRAKSQTDLATLELAASLLALGDVDAARRTAQAVRTQLNKMNSYNVLRADMILAECERSAGDTTSAIARLAAHEEYIRTESSNWQVAMYCRAFPELMGLFALAIDPDRLPVHMLRMMIPEYAERVLARTREMLGPELWTRLGTRLLGDEGLADFIDRDGRVVCRVRLFGGLEVNVGGRLVSERDWRKRKARLLFAMLVIRRGQDVPRDQLFEYLWPDMEEARARNNLYVIWSAMKTALMGAADKNTPCPFIENVGGVCRVIPDLVASDVEEFDKVLARAHEAEVAGDWLAALRAYERISEIYRADLLPGDVYDDWFAQMRDHYRVEFIDAMSRAGGLLIEQGEHTLALQFIRRALASDPLREDLYQAALRCQLAVGQRSAAIDTYLQCRVRLSEELGLDPSGETRELYQQILAMEEHPRKSAGSQGSALEDL